MEFSLKLLIGATGSDSGETRRRHAGSPEPPSAQGQDLGPVHRGMDPDPAETSPRWTRPRSSRDQSTVD